MCSGHQRMAECGERRTPDNRRRPRASMLALGGNESERNCELSPSQDRYFSLSAITILVAAFGRNVEGHNALQLGHVAAKIAVLLIFVAFIDQEGPGDRLQ